MSTLLAAINTASAQSSFGHYVQAMNAGGLVFVSGQLPARLDGTSLADMPFEAQARQSLANLLAIVEGAGLRHDRIAKVTAYLVGVEHWTAFNAILRRSFWRTRSAKSHDAQCLHTAPRLPDRARGHRCELKVTPAISLSVNSKQVFNR